MHRTDLEKPLLTGPSITAASTSRFVRLTCSGILVISCTIFGFSQCYAQQNVAEAARQEQTRKANQQKKTKHVYTDEDLKRAQILIPEDRAQVKARKNQQPLPAEEQSQDSVDAQALPPDVSLGEVARRYRRLRESLRLQEAAQFHLPFVDAPVFAVTKPSVAVASKPPVLAPPKFPVMPVNPVISIPEPPRVEPFRPQVKRSPFERPRAFISAPSHTVPSPPLAKHAAPPQAPAISTTPARPSTIPVAPAKPAAPPPIVRLMPPARIARHMTPAQPAAPVVRTAPSHLSTLSVAPSKPAAPGPDFSVMPSPAPAVHVAPAQPAAPVVRTAPARPSTLSVAPSKPAAPTPDFGVMPSPAPTVHATPAQPVAPVVHPTPSKPSTLGVAPSQPAAPVIPVAPSQPAAPAHAAAPAGPAKLNVLTVQPGDSLWKLAQQNLGGGLRWHDLLAANPAIVDPNHIVAGSQIFLPSVASRFRTATRILVQKGDTLSGIAQTQFGHASYWSCIAQANPTIQNASLIFEGQSLLLPASCKP
jgi:nucleoid-associated protein YgaU